MKKPVTTKRADRVVPRAVAPAALEQVAGAGGFKPGNPLFSVDDPQSGLPT
jgi:hypothetical protein